MKEIVLDTETTGLSVQAGHRIVEIGCIELENQIPTNNKFHYYLNPERKVSVEAFNIHGYSNEFLSKQKLFKEIAKDFLNFIHNKKLIIHNANFDLSFLNHELRMCNLEIINEKLVIDTLELARVKFPGSQVNLDALCKKFKIDNSKRTKHNALIDCELLLNVYVNLIDQKEPKLNFVKKEDISSKYNTKNNKYYSKKVVSISNNEITLHKKFLGKEFKKNFF